MSKFDEQAKLITEKNCVDGLFVFVGVFFCLFGLFFCFLIKAAEMLEENSEMGTPSSIVCAVEPLAITPLSVHPLYDY